MSATLKYISCPVSQLDLLEPIGVQTQVNSFKDIEYLLTSAIQDGAPITFEIGKDECYTDASEFVIKTVVEIQGENGTALTGKQFTNAEAAGTLEKVGVINNLGHSLWEQIVLLINDTEVKSEFSTSFTLHDMLCSTFQNCFSSTFGSMLECILHSDSTRNVFQNLTCFFLYGRKNDIFQ